jgi:hypothetical protein
LYAPALLLDKELRTAKLHQLVCTVQVPHALAACLNGPVQELRAENAQIKHELWALQQRLTSSEREAEQVGAEARGLESEVCHIETETLPCCFHDLVICPAA